MSRYDYQDNPQVQYWKEQAEEFQMAYETLRDELAKTLAKQICEEVEKAKMEREAMELENKELQEDIKFFNSLPWYEKIFHKFD